MLTNKIGLIGAGVMGEAIIGGALQAGCISAENCFVYDIDPKKLSHMAGRYCINACADLDALLENAGIILVAVKPSGCQALLNRIADKMDNKAIISIAAGWSSEKIKKLLPESARVLCVMPNMAAICGEGMSVLSAGHTLLPGELQFALQLFGAIGDTEIVDEKYFDIVTGVSGSGPAYAFMFIEAMMAAGIHGGLPAATARKLAIQTVLGAAKALKCSQKHPAELRDAVCTPGGTTIEAVFELEKSGFGGTVMSAVDKCAKKYKLMVEN
jgi:pyrroline-5-carboxylate reductase